MALTKAYSTMAIKSISVLCTHETAGYDITVTGIAIHTIAVGAVAIDTIAVDAGTIDTSAVVAGASHTIGSA